MPLSDLKVRNAKPASKPYKLTDERGLYLLVQPSGSKLWRFNYRFLGKQKTAALGVYPDVLLGKAREKLRAARSLLADGIDPALDKRQERQRKALLSAESFEAIAREWLVRRSPRWTENHAAKIKRRLERDIFPWLGNRPIREISAPELLATLRRIESRGAIETAHRAHQNCSQVFRYAIATGCAERDPAGDIRGALPPVKQSHHPTITDPKEIGQLLRAVEGYSGTHVTRCALQLLPLVFVRPGELRRAEWSEFDLEQAEWRIPASKMKMGAVHIVPLSTQAIEVLREVQPLTGYGRYVFPSTRGRGRPMSENTVNAALRKLGYTKEQMSGHGFRSMASTLLNEQGYHRDAIERQLAHSERNKVRAAYNYAEHLPERRQMMQAWADYLDTLRGAEPPLPAHLRHLN